MNYNGSAMIAMVGADCVGIAADRRLGKQLTTISTDCPKIFEVQPSCLIGMSGLYTDITTLHQALQYRIQLYNLQEERNMTPKVLSHLLSHMLYEKRFGPYYMEPIIAGIDTSVTPHTAFLSSMDLIGATMTSTDFCVAGSCTANLYGMAESFYRPNLSPDELKEVLSQCLLSSVDRDAITGWGGVVHIITKDGITTHELKGRQD
jgi:20S proteasome subunit beta 3